MKSTLPVFALVSFASAASAGVFIHPTNIVSAPSLFSNNVGVSYHRLSVTGVAGRLTSEDVSATAYLGASSVFVQASSTVGGNSPYYNHGIDAVSLGYVFRNLTNSVDVAVAVSANDTLRVAAYRSLGAGFAAAAQVAYNPDETQYGLGVTYKVTSQVSFEANYVHLTLTTFDIHSNDLSVGLRYAF